MDFGAILGLLEVILVRFGVDFGLIFVVAGCFFDDFLMNFDHWILISLLKCYGGRSSRVNLRISIRISSFIVVLVLV